MVESFTPSTSASCWGVNRSRGMPLSCSMNCPWCQSPHGCFPDLSIRSCRFGSGRRRNVARNEHDPFALFADLSASTGSRLCIDFVANSNSAPRSVLSRVTILANERSVSQFELSCLIELVSFIHIQFILFPSSRIANSLHSQLSIR